MSVPLKFVDYFRHEISANKIDLSSSTVLTPDSARTNYALSVGNRAAELDITMAAAASQNVEPVQMNINVIGANPTSSSTARLLRIRSTHDTTDMANLRIMNINTYMDVQKNMEAAYGLMSGVDFSVGTIAITTEAAVGVFNCDCPSGTITGKLRGIIINMSGASLPSTSIGVEVRSDGGAATLGEGIRIWSVGSCAITTGIKMQGSITTGINVAANTVMPQFITVGTSTNPIHWDGVAENILIHTECTDVTTSSKTTNKFVLDAAHSAATTSGRLECFRGEVKSYSTHNISASIRAVVGQVSFMGNCTYVGAGPQGCFGIVGSVWSGSNLTATGDVFAIGGFMGVETGSAYNGESAMIYLYQFGKTSVESLIRFDCNIGATNQMSYFIDADGLDLSSHHDFFSADTIDTASDTESDGTIKIRLSSTVYEIPIYAA